MKWRFPVFVVSLFTLGMHAVQAAEFKSVADSPAVMYDAPTERGRKVFIAPRGMPLEVILTQHGWSKVRDASGDLSWMEAKALTSQRKVVVTAANSKLYAVAEEGALVVATLDKGVLLELLAPAASGWVSVKHRDGVAGFVKAAEVWGE